MNNSFKRYIIFWISQTISQLGSAMTSFALILWVYKLNHSAMSISLMSFFSYVPYILVSLVAGSFVDQHSKKRIMLVSDSIAALCSVLVLVLASSNHLEIWSIYIVNSIIGFMNAFQSPASSVAIGKIVPKDKLSNVSGMNSFSSNLVTVLTPVLATSFFALGGLTLILIIDMVSFLISFLVLLFLIEIPEDYSHESNRKSAFAGARVGLQFLKGERAIFIIILTMALINFLSRLTYENILSPMILARSGNDSIALGIVTAVMGIGGIIGGVIVSAGKGSKDNIKMIYISAALSFLFGDLLMAMGRNVLAWSIAGLAASLPIPFVMARQNVILYRKVPESMQGRVFAVRNAIQYSTIPLGILFGGFLADYVFEPFMKSGLSITKPLNLLVGSGAGSGMAVMFLCTGLCGFLVSCISYRMKVMDSLRDLR